MPKIRKVVDPPKQKTKYLDPAVPQPPALVLMVMPCKTGKTTQLSNYFLSPDFYGQDYFDDVSIISTNLCCKVTISAPSSFNFGISFPYASSNVSLTTLKASVPFRFFNFFVVIFLIE